MVTIKNLKPCKVLVAGDLMLDRYTIGQAKRISPEAPVPVLSVKEERTLPGGAGNVALSLKAAGADVTLLGQVGSDHAGEELLALLKEEGVETHAVMVNQKGVTSHKQRLIADFQQLLRVDREEVRALPEPAENLLIERLPTLVEHVDVVAISDYAKGFLSRRLLSALIQAGRAAGKPVIIDPKGVDYTKYRGATLVKPNLKEALEASGSDESVAIEEVAKRLFKRSGTDHLLITRSEDGISIFEQNGEHKNFPVRIREVNDVTGAGDTVLAMLTMAFANQWSMDDAAELANIGAGIAIEHLGCHRVTCEQLEARVEEFSVAS